jgi:hypothetical protein
MSGQDHLFATAIGSFPYDAPTKAIDLILKSIPDAPVWPQLPKLGLNEQMEIQYSEGMPCRVIDREKNRMYFNTSGDYSEEFAVFYEAYMLSMDDPSYDFATMAISSDFSKGIYALEERLKKDGQKKKYIKVHTVGPCSFSLTIVDENKRAIYYNEEFRDMIVKALAMKCRWQIRKFRQYAEKIICFIDEPILSAFGSSTYISVKRDDVVSLIKEVVEAIHHDGALAGVHCCGNTDWSILIDAGVDIINFDAFGYGETIALYPEPMKGFIAKGGILAWGIVPTSEAVRNESAESLSAIFDRLSANLSEKSGIDRNVLMKHSIITPSCGTGSMKEPDAEKVFAVLHDLSLLLQNKYK